MGPSENQLTTCDTGELTTGIVSAVSEARGVDALSLPPLGETVDIGALETFVNGIDDSMSVSFTYQNLRVRVRDDGSVTVGGKSSDE